MSCQGELFPERVPQRTRRETSALYDHVPALRAAGYRVFRAGDAHLVNGDRYTARRLVALARICSLWPLPQ